jgi:pyruvate formate lyase activating enzyme
MSVGVIFDVKRFAVHDGPGIRTTAFFKGCPLSCQWCHNPEGQKLNPELMVRPARCTGCGDCITACETKAICLVDKELSVDRSLCTSCGDCAVSCPTDALEMVGREVTAKNLLAELERDVAFFDQSGGGVTLSGGEPLAQPDFLTELLGMCKAHKLHTTIDTSGYAPVEVIEKVAKLADLFLYDLKIIDDEKHYLYTGVSNERILENLHQLAVLQSPVIVRIPVIPGYTDTYENMDAIARFVAGLDYSYPVDLLPYHRAGGDKYSRLGMPYHLEATLAPSRSRLEEIADIFRRFQLPVMIGGEWYGYDRTDQAFARREY